jgi:transglutaminase-like putative cysteine protease
MDAFLQSTDVIDWQHPDVLARAQAVRGSLRGIDIARRCFEWVRDEIRHSSDYGTTAVTCSASEVLREGSGFCYAKSHLLAALLRANGFRAGLCYQRLCLDDSGSRFCLHGLNAVLLPEIGWYRLDPRGNKTGVNARFDPPHERLAFLPRLAGEVDVPGVLPDPLPHVVAAIRAHSDARSLGDNLPDWIAPSSGR